MSRAVHFVGIGGVGMSGLAQLAHQLGYTVSGSDRSFQPKRSPYRELIASGIQITPQDGSGLLTEDPLDVVYSTAIEADNPDLIGAHEQGAPFFIGPLFYNISFPQRQRSSPSPVQPEKLPLQGYLAGYLNKLDLIQPSIVAAPYLIGNHLIS